jgi:hypothetical protein
MSRSVFAARICPVFGQLRLVILAIAESWINYIFLVPKTKARHLAEPLSFCTEAADGTELI